MTRRRFNYIDLLRALAIFAVLLVHSHVAKYYAETGNVFSQFMSVTLGMISGLGVPLFFMISGALLLGREESYKDVLMRVLRIIVVLIGFSFIQYIFFGGQPELATFEGWRHRIIEIFNDKGPIEFIAYFFRYIWSKPVTTQYWYLYAYIDMLLLMPLLRKVCKAMDKNLFIYILAGMVLFVGVLPEMCKILNLDDLNINFTILENVIAYPLLGYYISHEEDIEKSKVKTCGLILGVFFLVNAIAYLLEYNIAGLEYFRPNVFVAPFVVFVFCAARKFEWNSKGNKVIYWISSASFGIYLTEFILHAFTLDIYQKSLSYMPYLLATCLRNLVSIAIGTVIFNLAKKIKLVRTFI